MLGILSDRALAETVANWSTTIGIILALAGGAYTLWKYRKDRQFKELDRARDAYAGFMKLALDYPEFYPGCWIAISQDPVLKNKFEWYMAHFLWSCEDILLSSNTDLGFVEGMRDTISEHRDYFISSDFLSKELNGYCDTLQTLISETVTRIPIVPGLRVEKSEPSPVQQTADTRAQNGVSDLPPA